MASTLISRYPPSHSTASRPNARLIETLFKKPRGSALGRSAQTQPTHTWPLPPLSSSRKRDAEPVHLPGGGKRDALGNICSLVRDLPADTFGAGHIDKRKPHRGSKGAYDDLAH